MENVKAVGMEKAKWVKSFGASPHYMGKSEKAPDKNAALNF